MERILHNRICHTYLKTNKLCENGSFCDCVHLTSSENKIICRYQKFQCECTKYNEIISNLVYSLGGCLMCKKTGFLSREELVQILDNRNCLCKCLNPVKVPYPYHKKIKTSCYVCETCKGIVK